MRRALVVISALLAWMTAAYTAPTDVSVYNAVPSSECVAWGVEKLKTTLNAAGCRVVPDSGLPISISISAETIRPSELVKKPEGFEIMTADRGITILGYSPPGAMYGCLELARRVKEAGRLPESLRVSDAPAMSLRGTCILLMKLGLYDYPVTPDEFPFFYDKDLWIEYLDFLAENRFNYIAFWNGHPFDYFVKLDKYPEAQDGLAPGLLERNHDMLLWLAREAEKRNIWLMFEFYNIHVSVYFAKAHHLPEHGIDKPTGLLRDYTGYCIERFVREFPSVGLYICPGESLRLEYTPDWIDNVIFAAVRRTGKTPPIMIRSWGIDLDHMKQVAGKYPRLYTERKFNVEMIASTDIDPENADWAKLSGNHVVNIHCLGNLEPFRWSPPSYIQRCMQSSAAAGATGLHLYPRKAWRWPYGCDRTPERELQWRRDWIWYEAWARYAWNPNRDPAQEQTYWTERLAQRYGAEAAKHVLRSLEAGADVLPGIQRLVWLGNDNHTVVGAGVTLEQLQQAKGIPFLELPGLVRIPDYIKALKKGVPIPGTSPVAFLADEVAQADEAAAEAQEAVKTATGNLEEVKRIATDAQAVLLIAKFYHEKLQAAAEIAIQSQYSQSLEHLRASAEHFRALTDLTRQTYESLSDVPAWNPSKELPCPYHWSDILPLYEAELKQTQRR